ncbi:MAG: hypothetical protein JKX71_15385 [Amylibacter sp.]|nr:hypothetical protein [Amylibacter sp.]
MTALEQFDRLESLGLWKESETSQKKEVIVSFGKASLVLSDNHDTPLSHWSLGAVEIRKTGDERVLYAPDKTGFETLEITDPTMNKAISKVLQAIHKPKSQRGRIRLLSTLLIMVCLFLLAIFWFPKALTDYTAQIVSDAKAREIGAKLMPHINQYAGQPCQATGTDFVIRKLEDRLTDTSHSTLFITDMGARYSTHLPGGIILANRNLVEGFSGPEVLAGFVLMERVLQKQRPAIHALFSQAGPIATLSFLITGDISDEILGSFAKNLMTRSVTLPDTTALLKIFKAVDISSTPFANAMNNQVLATDDPVKGPFEPILTDPEWLALQSICEG